MTSADLLAAVHLVGELPALASSLDHAPRIINDCRTSEQIERDRRAHRESHG